MKQDTRGDRRHKLEPKVYERCYARELIVYKY